MMTTQNITQAKAAFRPFSNNAIAYKALLTENELPLSIDIDELTGALRAKLFAQLLAVDAGLQMRFNMLQTEAGQQELINSTINLAGYPIVPNLKQRIAQLEQSFMGPTFYQGSHLGSMRFIGKNLNWLLQAYDLDIEQWLESERIDWTGKATVLAYFTVLADQLTQIQKLARMRSSMAGLHGIVGEFLASFFIGGDIIKPDEHALMSRMVPMLEQSGKLADFPDSL